MSLYPKQAEIVDRIWKAYQTDGPLLQNRIYLAGEPGVGKTYMGSAVIARTLPTRPVLLVVPNNIVTKWKRVLLEYAPHANIHIMDHKAWWSGKDKNGNPHPTSGQLHLKPNDVNLIPNRYFNRLFCYDEDETSKYLSQMSYDQYSKVTPSGTTQRNYNSIVNYENTLDKKPLLVYDEIHQISNSKLECFAQLMQGTKLPGLFLSGTIFNLSLKSIGRVITVTHNKLCALNNDANDKDAFAKYEGNFAAFVRRYWIKIAVSVSLKEVKRSAHVKKIHQEIVPLHAVKINNQELCYYNAVLAQLEVIGKKPNVAELVASNFLDFPGREQSISTKRPANRTALRERTHTLVATPLLDLKLSHTKKYRKLCDYLKHFDKDNAIIYATDPDLIRALTKQLNHDGFKAAHLPSSLNVDKYADYINKTLSGDTKIFVVNPRDVNVGVDLHAGLLIWYQLLLNMTDIIQAQRRVYRLSSKKDSKVVFLYYELTYQEKLVRDISNAAKYNAGSYGVQEDNNLTRLTNVLLGNLKQK